MSTALKRRRHKRAGQRAQEPVQVTCSWYGEVQRSKGRREGGHQAEARHGSTSGHLKANSGQFLAVP